jgi:hypothetical protein
MKNLPNIASRWMGGELTEFKIEKLEHRDTGVWVYYQNAKTGQQYNCLVEAFIARFKEQVV